MRNVTDFLFLLIPLSIFLVGITITYTMFNDITSEVAVVKDSYANDEVYSEAALKAYDESIISRDELLAMLMRSPTCNLTVRDDVSNITVTVKASRGSDTIVKIIRNQYTPGSEEMILSKNFGINRWSVDEVNPSKYLQASKYRVREISFADGTLNSVLFYGEN